MKNPEYFMKNDQFYKLIKNNDPKILLIGSSHMQGINATKVNQDILDSSYTVFNLGRVGDFPSTRQYELKQIIESDPKLVVYGLSYRDFEFPQSNEFYHIFLKPVSCSGIMNKKIEFTTNPHVHLRYIFDRIFSPPSEGVFASKNSPFLIYYDNDMDSPNDIIVNHKKSQMVSWDLPIQKYSSICGMENIIENLKDNGIKIILIKTPLHPLLKNDLNDFQKQQFSDTMNYFSDEYNVSVINFEDSFDYRNEWLDADHLWYNSTNFNDYNSEITYIINNELFS